jgi:hypothetical protein
VTPEDERPKVTRQRSEQEMRQEIARIAESIQKMHRRAQQRELSRLQQHQPDQQTPN